MEKWINEKKVNKKNEPESPSLWSGTANLRHLDQVVQRWYVICFVTPTSTTTEYFLSLFLFPSFSFPAEAD